MEWLLAGEVNFMDLDFKTSSAGAKMMVEHIPPTGEVMVEFESVVLSLTNCSRASYH